MKKINRIVLLIGLFSSNLCLANRICDSYNPETDNSRIKGSRNIVFFASWCQSCLESIRSSDSKQDIYIAVFDSHSKAEKALKFALGSKAKTSHCLIDKNNVLAKRFKVSNLPKTLSVTEQSVLNWIDP